MIQSTQFLKLDIAKQVAMVREAAEGLEIQAGPYLVVVLCVEVETLEGRRPAYQMFEGGQLMHDEETLEFGEVLNNLAYLQNR